MLAILAFMQDTPAVFVCRVILRRLRGINRLSVAFRDPCSWMQAEGTVIGAESERVKVFREVRETIGKG